MKKQKPSELESYESLLSTEKLQHTTPVTTLGSTEGRSTGQITRANSTSDLGTEGLEDDIEDALSEYAEYTISQPELDRATKGRLCTLHTVLCTVHYVLHTVYCKYAIHYTPHTIHSFTIHSYTHTPHQR
jgi:hypothetical protein